MINQKTTESCQEYITECQEDKQILSCPVEDADLYRQYLIKRKIEFTEKIENDEVCFTFSKKYRPFAWKINFK